MRFILKSAFLLGLVAFLLPFGERGETSADMSWFGALAGARQAIADLGGFCDRAPDACATGREAAVFAGERIGDGFALAYGWVDHLRQPETARERQATRTVELAPGPETDPIATGAVEPSLRPLPHAYLAPKRPASPAVAEPGADASAKIAIPSPAPRI